MAYSRYETTNKENKTGFKPDWAKAPPQSEMFIPQKCYLYHSTRQQQHEDHYSAHVLKWQMTNSQSLGRVFIISSGIVDMYQAG